MGADADSFVRWDSGQTLATSMILSLADDVIAGRPLALDPDFVAAAKIALLTALKWRAGYEGAVTPCS